MANKNKNNRLLSKTFDNWHMRPLISTILSFLAVTILISAITVAQPSEPTSGGGGELETLPSEPVGGGGGEPVGPSEPIGGGGGKTSENFVHGLVLISFNDNATEDQIKNLIGSNGLKIIEAQKKQEYLVLIKYIENTANFTLYYNLITNYTFFENRNEELRKEFPSLLSVYNHLRIELDPISDRLKTEFNNSNVEFISYSELSEIRYHETGGKPLFYIKFKEGVTKNYISNYINSFSYLEPISFGSLQLPDNVIVPVGEELKWVEFFSQQDIVEYARPEYYAHGTGGIESRTVIFDIIQNRYVITILIILIIAASVIFWKIKKKRI